MLGFLACAKTGGETRIFEANSNPYSSLLEFAVDKAASGHKVGNYLKH